MTVAGGKLSGLRLRFRRGTGEFTGLDGDGVCGGIQIASREKTRPLREPFGRVGGELVGVALAANLSGFPMIHFPGVRVFDAVRGLRLVAPGVAIERVLKVGDVFAGRAVAGFAGDAQLGDLSSGGLSLARHRHGRLAGDGVALNADFVPLGIDRGAVRVAEEGVLDRCPFLVSDQPAIGERMLHVASLIADPVDLQVVGAGRHGQALHGLLDAVRAHGGDPVLVPLFLEVQSRLAKRQFGAVPLGQDGVRLGQLRHRAMVAFVPAIVLTGMTGPTSLRGGVSIAGVGVRAEPNLGGGGPEEFALGSGRCVVGLVFQVAQTKREQERRGQQAKRLVSICVQQKREDRHEQQQRGDDDLQPQRVDGCRHSAHDESISRRRDGELEVAVRYRPAFGRNLVGDDVLLGLRRKLLHFDPLAPRNGTGAPQHIGAAGLRLE